MNSNVYCPFCGSIITLEQEFCHNCGASVKDLAKKEQTPSTFGRPITQQTYTSQNYGQQNAQYTQPQQVIYKAAPKKSDDSSGLVALIFGILACAGVLPCVGSIIAIAVGSSAREDGNSMGNTGYILGWISCCCNIGFVILIILYTIGGIL